MLANNYSPRFAVGVVAGSSVLGMIIPPSAMLIIYSFVAEQSVGDMFLAGVVPGIMLAIAYIAAIWGTGKLFPKFVGGRPASDYERMPWKEIASKTLPTLGLITIVLGGIYTGWMTPVEAGAAGSLLPPLPSRACPGDETRRRQDGRRLSQHGGRISPDRGRRRHGTTVDLPGESGRCGG